MYLSRRQYKLVAIRILEDRERSPRLLFRLGGESNPARAELPVGGADVVTGKGAIEKRADPILMPLGREEHHARWRVGDPQFDPALLLIETLIRRDFEAGCSRNRNCSGAKDPAALAAPLGAGDGILRVRYC